MHVWKTNILIKIKILLCKIALKFVSRIKILLSISKVWRRIFSLVVIINYIKILISIHQWIIIYYIIYNYISSYYNNYPPRRIKLCLGSECYKYLYFGSFWGLCFEEQNSGFRSKISIWIISKSKKMKRDKPFTVNILRRFFSVRIYYKSKH